MGPGHSTSWAAGSEGQLRQDPVPAVDHPLIDDKDIAAPQDQDSGVGPVHPATRDDRLGVGLDLPGLRVAAAAPMGLAFASRRKRTGTSISRRNWPRSCRRSNRCREDFNKDLAGGKKVSLADVIVFGGCAGRGGRCEEGWSGGAGAVQVRDGPTPRRELTDVESFAVLEPTADGFRRITSTASPTASQKNCSSIGQGGLKLSAPELTVLVGGLPC